MLITLSPQRRDDSLAVAKLGDVVTINGEAFDFSTLGEGGSIPAGSIPCQWITGDVERVGGEIHLMLILPHGPNPSASVAFPEPLVITEDGPIAIPFDPAPELEPTDVDA